MVAKNRPYSPWRIAAFLLILLSWSLCHPPAAVTAPAETAWKLVLDHGTFGRCTGIFSETRIRFDDGVLKRLILPPYTESCLYNVDTKKMIQAPTSTFENLTGVNYKSATVKKIDSTRLLGLLCTHYRIDLPKRRITCEYWATHDIKMHPKLAISCCQLGCAPPGFGVPLRVIWKDRRGREERLYSVQKLERYSPKPADFLPPQGYKEARDLFELHFCDPGTKYGDAVDKAFMLDYGPKKKKRKKTED